MAWIFQHVRKVWDFNTCGLPKQTDATAHQLAWLRLRLICRCARSSAHVDAALSPDFLGEQFDDDAQLGEFFKGVFRLLEYRHRSVYFMVIDVLTAVHESVSQPAVSSIIEVVNGWLARTDNADASAPRPGAQFRSHFLEASLELLLQLFYGGTGGILKAPQISVPILMEFVEAWAMVRTSFALPHSQSAHVFAVALAQAGWRLIRDPLCVAGAEQQPRDAGRIHPLSLARFLQEQRSGSHRVTFAGIFPRSLHSLRWASA
jgi:hypothetical protein